MGTVTDTAAAAAFHERASRWRAVGGIVGPAAFIAAWAVLGTGRRGYSPADDPISRLAAMGASSRPAMTGGFLAFGAGVSLYAAALRPALPGGAAIAAAATAAATFGIAATPLDSALGGRPHAVAAGIAYAALAAMPILGARTFAARGRRGTAAASLAAGVAAGAALLASSVVDHRVGLYQRLGLTIGDAWIVATAAWLLRSSTSPRGRRPV